MALLLGGCEAELRDFANVVARFGGRYHEDLSVLELPVGERRGFPSVAALRDFALTQWTAQAPALRCCWLEPGKPIEDQLTTLVAARPLSHWASESTSPLRAILDKRRILTWFQPVFSGDDLAIWGYECLARAVDDEGEVIPPADLFRWARDENLIFMLDRVCREQHIENFAAAQIPAHVACLINFLPTVIYDPAVCLRSTFKTADRVGLTPSRVVFEVVETEQITDRAHLRNILDEYRDAGFRIALDDVGAGHAGIALIGDLAPDVVKIDRGLVKNCLTSPVYATICRSIVEITRSAGKRVLAEGIETPEEYTFFRELGCDLYQGFLFGRPQRTPATESLYHSADPGRETTRSALT